MNNDEIEISFDSLDCSFEHIEHKKDQVIGDLYILKKVLFEALESYTPETIDDALKITQTFIDKYA